MGEIAAWAYARAVERRNRRFDRGERVVELDRPVISIGNLSVGGTGKTPMVAWTVRRLLEAGMRPCIAMRGYRAQKRRGRRISDEAEEYRAIFGESVPVVAQPNRIAGLRSLFATPAGRAVDRVVLDDGFQHRRLARAADIVLIDATRDPFDDRPLPAGWLREPVTSLKRSGAVVITHAERAEAGAVDRISRRVAEITGREPIAVTRHAWAGFVVHEGGRTVEKPVTWLSGRRVIATCAIGNPEAFIAEVTARAGAMLGRIQRRDHDRFGPKTVERIAATARACGADTIVCTGKDWSKLSGTLPSRWDGAVAIPMLVLLFERGERELASFIGASIA